MELKKKKPFRRSCGHWWTILAFEKINLVGPIHLPLANLLHESPSQKIWNVARGDVPKQYLPPCHLPGTARGLHVKSQD